MLFAHHAVRRVCCAIDSGRSFYAASKAIAPAGEAVPMTNENKVDCIAPKAKIDWRITLGLVLTVVWLLLGGVYMFAIGEFSEFIPHNAADFGSFLQGVFAPLAFLWLVLGHFLQQGEISANTRAIELQELSTRRIELLSRRDSFFKLQGLVQEQLGTIAFYLYISIEGSAGAGNISDEQVAEDRQHMDKGDYALFMRRLLMMCVVNRGDVATVRGYFLGTEIRRRHSENFVSTFEKLLRIANEVDEDGIIVNALKQGSAMGRFYDVICQVRQQQP
jgi:hypothetical protein